ncbi:transposable element Tcb1 transposase [Trichonephila clavipes]|nr:transposable element Tcb1 transposase [Trichonephila clavipes]
MSDYMQPPVCYQDLKTSIQHYIHHILQETWDQQIINKLHSIYPSTAHWEVVPVRRYDVRLIRLRIRHTRLTHRHLLLGESPPVGGFCQCGLSILHILIECPKTSGSERCHLHEDQAQDALDRPVVEKTDTYFWFHARGNRTAREWNQVVFSDESRFNLSSDHNRVRVWRPSGERLNPAFALQRHTAPTAGVMVLGAIAYNTRSP